METVSRLLRRRFPLVVLALLAYIAFLDARGLASFVGGLLGPDARALAATRRPLPPEDPALSRHETSADAILANNPFDSTWHPHDEAVDPDAPSQRVACDDVRVLGIVGGDADYSFAALSVTGEKSTILRRRGGAVGTRTVAYVARDRVFLSEGDTVCEARMFGSRAAPAASSASATPPPLPVTGIVRRSPTDLDVDRSVVERLLENPQDLMKVAQLAPEKNGIRIASVRPDSPVAALGIQRGDLLQTIEGYKMSDPQQMLEAYARLRTAEKLTLVLVRGEKTMSVEYRIR